MDNIAICDDMAMDRKRLITYIRNHNVDQDSIRIYEYNSGESLLRDMQKIKFSVVFMDILMEGMSGYETAARLRKLDARLILVYCSGSVDPSPESFETEPYRYIKKNISDKAMDEYIDVVISKMKKEREIPLIQARSGKDLIYIMPDDIVYIEKFKRSMLVYLSESAYNQYKVPAGSEIRIFDKLENFYTDFKKHGFGCPHSSFVINFRYLCSSTTKTLRLKNCDVIFAITQTKIKEFNKQKNEYMLSQYGEGLR